MIFLPLRFHRSVHRASIVASCVGLALGRQVQRGRVRRTRVEDNSPEPSTFRTSAAIPPQCIVVRNT